MKADLPTTKITKLKKPSLTTTPTAENTSPHEVSPVPVRDEIFYDLVKPSLGENALSLDILNKLYDAWKIGCDNIEAAAMAGVNPGTVSTWVNSMPELKEIRDRVKATPRVTAKRNVIRRLNNDPTGEFSLKYLEKVKPEEFGGKGAVININNTNVSVSEKSSSLTDFMSQFGGDIIDG